MKNINNKQMPKVYLAGGITGMTFDGCNDWREYAIRWLYERGIAGYSPLRAKEYLKAVNEQSGISAMQKQYDGFVLSTPKGINSRDHYDCMTSDLILVNLMGAKLVSIGTVMEIAWGFAYRKPVVVAMEKEGNLHDHPMIRESANFFLPSLDDALQTAAYILLPYQVEPLPLEGDASPATVYAPQAVSEMRERTK